MRIILLFGKNFSNKNDHKLFILARHNIDVKMHIWLGFYCEDYDELVSILDFMTTASEKLEEIHVRKVILITEKAIIFKNIDL